MIQKNLPLANVQYCYILKLAAAATVFLLVNLAYFVGIVTMHKWNYSIELIYLKLLLSRKWCLTFAVRNFGHISQRFAKRTLNFETLRSFSGISCPPYSKCNIFKYFEQDLIAGKTLTAVILMRVHYCAHRFTVWKIARHTARWYRHNITARDSNPPPLSTPSTPRIFALSAKWKWSLISILMVLRFFFLWFFSYFALLSTHGIRSTRGAATLTLIRMASYIGKACEKKWPSTVGFICPPTVIIRLCTFLLVWLKQKIKTTVWGCILYRSVGRLVVGSFAYPDPVGSGPFWSDPDPGLNKWLCINFFVVWKSHKT
jgi:hypothetical protein